MNERKFRLAQQPSKSDEFTIKELEGAGFRIRKLDEEKLEKMRASILVAFAGSGKCNSEDLKKSCFAAEYCTLDKGVSPMFDTRMLLRWPFKYICENKSGDFVGSISANFVKNDKHVSNIIEDGIIIYNFCVALEFRKQGVGTLLIHTLQKETNCETMIALVRTQGVDYERVKRLKTTYEKMNFCVVKHTSLFTIYRRTFTSSAPVIRGGSGA